MKETFDLLANSPQLYAVLLLGAALGAMVGMLMAFLWWHRVCEAYEAEADLHIDVAMRANALRAAAERREAHLIEQNRHLTAMLSGEPDSGDEWKNPTDIQFP